MNRYRGQDDPIFKYLIKYMRESKGIAPTVREIAKAVGLRSLNSVYSRLRRLEREGHITFWKSGKARAIQVAGGRWYWADELPDSGDGNWRCDCEISDRAIDSLVRYHNLHPSCDECCRDCGATRPDQEGE